MRLSPSAPARWRRRARRAAASTRPRTGRGSCGRCRSPTLPVLPWATRSSPKSILLPPNASTSRAVSTPNTKSDDHGAGPALVVVEAPAFATHRGAREHDAEEEEDDHRADVDQHLDPRDELGDQQDVLRRRAGQHDDEEQRRVHDVVRAHDPDRRARHRDRDHPERELLLPHGYFLPFTSAPISSGSGSGTDLHPLAELHLVVEELGDARLGVLVVGAPEQGVERAHLDADPAVHAERVVDVEPVEHADRALAAAFTPRRALLLVPLDVDAPVGALTGRTACRRCSSPP